MSSDLMLMRWDSFVETVIMVGLSGFIGSVFGIPLGILLHVTDPGGGHPMPIFNKVLGWMIAVAPFIARLVETSLREVDKGLIEAARAMGATNLQIVMKVLLPEAMPGIVAGLTISLVSLVGYSAMAGAIGGGGLGDMGIRYGYQRFMPDVMLAVVVILIVFVQAMQSFGDWLVRRMSHK